MRQGDTRFRSPSFSFQTKKGSLSELDARNKSGIPEPEKSDPGRCRYGCLLRGLLQELSDDKITFASFKLPKTINHGSAEHSEKWGEFYSKIVPDLCPKAVFSQPREVRSSKTLGAAL